MLRRLLADYKADYLACVFDARGKTFRDEMYAQYKANRAPMPDELGAQVGPLFRSIRASGWPLLQIEGVEADDVIGTLAREAEKRGLRCVISTGDKDLAQLVSDRVTLVNTMSNERLDPAGVKEKFGVPPERMLDSLTLVGDAVDNVPGVDKVGPKTAAKWLEQYGALEGGGEHAGEIGGAVGENLRKALDWLPKAQGLLAGKIDVGLPVGLEELKLGPRDEKQLAELISRFGFKSWPKEAARDTAPPPAASPPPVRADSEERRYETLFEEADLARWVKDLEAAELVAFDTETTSLDPMQARLGGMTFSVLAGRAAYLPLPHHYAGAPHSLRAGRCRPDRRLRRRGRRSHASDPPCAPSQTGGRGEAPLRLPLDRAPCSRSPLQDGEGRGPDRRGAARGDEPRIGTENARARSPGPQGSGAALQSRFAETDRRDLLRKERNARHQEDAFGSALDRRGRAGETRARPPAGENPPRLPGNLQAQVHLHGQVAEDG